MDQPKQPDADKRERYVGYIADMPSPEFDEVVLQADYAKRAMLSLYRFRLQNINEIDDPEDRSAEPALAGAKKKRKSTVRRVYPGRRDGRGVHYMSDHPPVRIFNLSLILLLVLFESAANAYFFAQQSAFGLSGGMFQAAAVSLANVATAYFIIGFWGLRHITVRADFKFPWTRWDFLRAAGFGAIIFGVIMVLLVNLSAAHYRNLLDLQALDFTGEQLDAMETVTRGFPHFWIDAATCDAILRSPIGDTIGSAATNAMCRPFALHSLDAMVLFALGLAIAALAAFEGRRSDAAFPGLSDAARQVQRTRQDLQYALEDYYDSAKDQIERAEDLVGKDPDFQLSPEDKLEIRRRLVARAEPYRKLLETHHDVLGEEFAIPQTAVKYIVQEDKDLPPYDSLEDLARRGPRSS